MSAFVILYLVPTAIALIVSACAIYSDINGNGKVTLGDLVLYAGLSVCPIVNVIYIILVGGILVGEYVMPEMTRLSNVVIFERKKK